MKYQNYHFCPNKHTIPLLYGVEKPPGVDTFAILSSRHSFVAKQRHLYKRNRDSNVQRVLFLLVPRFLTYTLTRAQSSPGSNICKDLLYRDKIEVPDPLTVKDLISCKLNDKRKLASLIRQYQDIFFPIFRKARPSFLRVLQRVYDSSF